MSSSAALVAGALPDGDLPTKINAQLDVERARVLQRLADNVAEGNASAAIRHLIDVHAGKEIERAEQANDPVPQPVVRWKRSRLDAELIGFVAGLVRAGNLQETARDIAGITPRQWTSWTKRGRADRIDGRESLYADLVNAVAKADGEVEAETIAQLRRLGRSQAKPLMFLLERQKPDRYGERRRVDQEVKHSFFPMIDWDRLDPGQTRTLIELLRIASPEQDDPRLSKSMKPVAELLPGDVLEAADIGAEAFEVDEKPDA